LGKGSKREESGRDRPKSYKSSAEEYLLGGVTLVKGGMTNRFKETKTNQSGSDLGGWGGKKKKKRGGGGGKVAEHKIKRVPYIS